MKSEKRFPMKKTSELLWLFGILFVALGVAICSKANLGVSMIAATPFILYEAFGGLWQGFSVGMMEYLVQGVVLCLLCLIIRRADWRYLLAFASAVIYGYTLDLFLWILGSDPFSAVWLRYAMLILGDTLTAFGVACFFRTYLPLQVYELFVSEFSRTFRLEIHRVKLCFDFTLLGVSAVLTVVLFGDVFTFDWASIFYSDFHHIGFGTVITTFINSPIIAAWGKLLDRLFRPTPAFPQWKKAIGIREETGE